MSVFTVSLLALASADYFFVPVPAAQPGVVNYYQAEAAAPAALPFLARADVVMNTQYQEERSLCTGTRPARGRQKGLSDRARLTSSATGSTTFTEDRSAKEMP